MKDTKQKVTKPVLSIVSPVFCESHGVGTFIKKVEEVLFPLSVPYEIILIDDGSADDSWTHMQKEAASSSCLHCLRLSRNFGKEAALVAGLEVAKGDAVIILDSDLQHPPELIPEMVKVWREGADIVEAQKNIRQKESQVSRFVAQSFYTLLSFVSPFNLQNASDFRLLDKKVLRALQRLPERRVFFRGMSSWVGFKREVIYFTPAERQVGGSKWSLLAKLMLALDSLSAYSTKFLYLMWGLCALFIAGSFLVGANTLWMKFSGRSSDGFTTVILLVLITGATLLGSVCILSLYIRQIFYEVKQRPPFSYQ